jgi:hypothetical protein
MMAEDKHAHAIDVIARHLVAEAWEQFALEDFVWDYTESDRKAIGERLAAIVHDLTPSDPSWDAADEYLEGRAELLG